MAQHQDLCFERGSRSEESDQPTPDQPAELAHRAEDSADSLPQANRFGFATGTTVFSMVFGTLDQSISAARRLHRRHAAVKGQLPWTAGPFPAGSSYCANAVPALRWVYATLIETALIAYELVLPPLTPQQRERYYRESLLFAGLFGIPKDCLPQDWTAFSAYFAAMLQSGKLSVADRTRSIARRLVTGADFWLPVPASYHDLTVALLPQPVRKEFGFSLDTAKQCHINRTIALVRRLHPFLPARLRYVGPYQEAEQRLAGRLTPDLVTQMCNRFWIGRTELPSGGL